VIEIIFTALAMRAYAHVPISPRTAPVVTAAAPARPSVCPSGYTFEAYAGCQPTTPPPPPPCIPGFGWPVCVAHP
jgi:hypothetical protein